MSRQAKIRISRSETIARTSIQVAAAERGSRGSTTRRPPFAAAFDISRPQWFAPNPRPGSPTAHATRTSKYVIGDSGTGKSHLLIGLGTAAAENGYRVRYTTAAALVNELVEAADDKTLSRTIARYGRVRATPAWVPTMSRRRRSGRRCG
jgi:hypothetical protein